MALRRAMLQPFRFISEDKDPCDKICRLACSLDCHPPCLPDYCSLYAPPPPPPPAISRTHHHISLLVIIASVLSTVFLLFAYYAVIRRYWRRRRIAATQSLPDQINTVHHEDHDEGQNSIHYIWYLTTPGLDESIIKSIAVVKYREGDGLIEGTECAVCLGEFREDESLRLLPKCNHAFHIPCIDTWLRSHVNCPLCRAIVVSSAAGASSAGPSSSSSGLAEENQVGNSRRIADGSDRFASARSSLRPDELELEGDEGRRDAESAKDGSSPNLNRGFRVQSDLAHGYRSGEIGLERLTDDGEQQVRRSVSMDSSAAAMIVISMGNLLPVDSEGSSSSAAAKPSGMKRIVPKHGRNPSFFKLMGCYSKGSFLQRGPVAMKRSFSTGGKFLLSKHSRSRSGSSALPL